MGVQNGCPKVSKMGVPKVQKKVLKNLKKV
jgi:hypothetical protein